MDTSTKPSPLQGFELLALHGRDALAFAQAQFCNDVRELAVGQWQWSGWLTPKGRVMALFALLRTGEDALWMVLPDAPAVALAERLQRFVFRSRLTLEQPADWIACASWTALGGQAANRAAGDARRGWQLDFSGEGSARTLHLVPREHAGAVGDIATGARWRLQDIRHGLPRLAFDAAQGWTPQMLSLDRLGAYSVRKGCYPGQEIVARTHFLGQAKRGLVRLYATVALPPQGEVTDAEGRALGPIVCVAAATEGTEALAVVPLDPVGVRMSIDATAVEPLPLLDGLRR